MLRYFLALSCLVLVVGSRDIAGNDISQSVPEAFEVVHAHVDQPDVTVSKSCIDVEGYCTLGACMNYCFQHGYSEANWGAGCQCRCCKG